MIAYPCRSTRISGLVFPVHRGILLAREIRSPQVRNQQKGTLISSFKIRCCVGVRVCMGVPFEEEKECFKVFGTPPSELSD